VQGGVKNLASEKSKIQKTLGKISEKGSKISEELGAEFAAVKSALAATKGKKFAERSL